MAQSHLGHDARVGSHNVIANSVSLAGHVHVGDWTRLSGHAAVHQFVRIGDYAFIAANAMVSGDVPAFCLAAGDRATLRGLNTIGLRRADFSAPTRLELRRAYRLLWSRRWSDLEEYLDAVCDARSVARGLVSHLYQSAQRINRPVCAPARRRRPSE